MRYRPAMTAQNTADDILIDLDAESQGDLLSNAGTTPTRIPSLHRHDGVDQVSIRSVRARTTSAPGGKQR